jgi:hypothetical protein
VKNYESLLRKNKKVPDGRVILTSAKANFVLVTTDKRMEAEWVEDIIMNRAKVLLLTDECGGPIHWASALICGQSAWTRVLLDHHGEPLTMRVNRNGSVTKVTGEKELRERSDALFQSNVVRAKRSGETLPRRVMKKHA